MIIKQNILSSGTFRRRMPQVCWNTFLIHASIALLVTVCILKNRHWLIFSILPRICCAMPYVCERTILLSVMFSLCANILTLIALVGISTNISKARDWRMKRQQDFWTTFSVMPTHDVFTDLSKTIICGRKDCVNVSE